MLTFLQTRDFSNSIRKRSVDLIFFFANNGIQKILLLTNSTKYLEPYRTEKKLSHQVTAKSVNPSNCQLKAAPQFLRFEKKKLSISPTFFKQI